MTDRTRTETGTGTEKKRISWVGRLSRVITLVTVLVLFTAAGITGYAWYAENRALHSRQMEFDLDADDAVASYKVYRYDLKADPPGGTTKDASGTNLAIENIDFNQYDLIFTKRNRYTPVFAHIIITRIETMPLSGQITLTLTNTSNAAGTDTFDTLPTVNGQDNLGLASSILRFTAMVDKGFEVTGEQSKGDAAFYDYVDRFLYDTTLAYQGTERHNVDATHSDASGSFFTAVPVDGVGSYTRTKAVDLVLDYAESDWDDIGTEQVLNLYLYMTYDTGMIECLSQERNMNVISIGQNVIDFENDLGTLTIKCGNGN